MSLLSTFRAMLRRDTAQQVRRFEGAGSGRRYSGTSNFGAYRTETAVANPALRNRARHLAVNNPWAANGVDALVTGLAGTGIVPASTVTDPARRKKLQASFKAWAKTCDADGLTDYYGLQANVARALVVDGESFIHLLQTSKGLKLRLIPAELVESTHGTADYRIQSGIEFDAAGNRIAYHVRTNPLSTQTVRIPAEDIIHVFMPLGAGQVRGTSWLAPIILKLSDLDGLEDALLMGFKVAALHAGFLTNLSDNATLPYDGQASGSEMETTLEPGTVKVLPPGVDIKFNSPQQAQQSTEFAAYQLRAVAAGLGVPEFLLTGDMRGANYSSMRSALIAFRQRIERIQYQILVPQMLDKIWQRAMMFETEDLGVEHYPPALPWVDPLKDVEATQAEIAAGLTSRRQAVARRGYDIEDLDEEISNDRKRESALGLQFVSNSVSTKNESTPPKPPAN